MNLLRLILLFICLLMLVVTATPDEKNSADKPEKDEVFELDPIIVTGQRPTQTVKPKTVKGEQLKNIPGAAGDALRGIMTLPSIGIPNDFFGVLYIRGSDPYSNLYYFDRTPLGYPFHWGGILSTVSSETLDRIDIYAGGYGAEFGLDAQNVIDIYTRSYTDDQLYGKFFLNIFYSEGLIEGRIKDKGYFSVSGRRSYLDLIARLFINDQLPFFSDYQAKLTYSVKENHFLTINAFNAIDKFHLKSVDNPEPESLQGSALFQNGFNAQGVHLQSNISDSFISSLSITRSVNTLITDFKTSPVEEDVDELDINYAHVNAPVWTLREDAYYKLTPKLQIQPGLLLSYSPIKSESYHNVLFDNERQIINKKPKQDLWRSEGYLQAQYNPISNISIRLGIRTDYLNLIDKPSIQPRGSINLNLPTESDIRFAYGQYEQNPTILQLTGNNGNRSLKPSLARHYVLELEHMFPYNTQLKLATYYKNIERTITEDAIKHYLNQGAGFIYGSEVFIRQSFSDKLWGWISYGYTHREQRQTPNSLYQPYLFDNTHIVSVVANAQVKSTINVGLKWQYLSGTSESPISSILLVQDPVTRGINPIVQSLDKLLRVDMDTYHRLDIRQTYKRKIFGLQVTSVVEILNVFNRKNKIKLIFDPDLPDIQDDIDQAIAEIESELEGENSIDVLGINRDTLNRLYLDFPQLSRIYVIGIIIEF